MNKKHLVRLTSEERSELDNLVKKGETPAYRIKHANILLAVDADGLGWTDEKTANPAPFPAAQAFKKQEYGRES